MEANTDIEPTRGKADTNGSSGTSLKGPGVTPSGPSSVSSVSNVKTMSRLVGVGPSTVTVNSGAKKSGVSVANGSNETSCGSGMNCF